MDKLKKLMVVGWELSKYFFNRDFKTPEEYGEFVDLGNELLKKVGAEYGLTGKEYKVARRMIVAVNEYCDQTWRETHTGEQLSLFGREN